MLKNHLSCVRSLSDQLFQKYVAWAKQQFWKVWWGDGGESVEGIVDFDETESETVVAKQITKKKKKKKIK